MAGSFQSYYYIILAVLCVIVALIRLRQLWVRRQANLQAAQMNAQMFQAGVYNNPNNGAPVYMMGGGNEAYVLAPAVVDQRQMYGGANLPVAVVVQGGQPGYAAPTAVPAGPGSGPASSDAPSFGPRPDFNPFLERFRAANTTPAITEALRAMIDFATRDETKWALQLGVKEAVISAGMALRASHAEAWAEDIPKLFGTLLSALPG